ncbi:MAG: ABC transporter permease, partial [Rhizobiales bacterium]|nr:ABC transporter permease [Hyphomicrobiales bacterium]
MSQISIAPGRAAPIVDAEEFELETQAARLRRHRQRVVVAWRIGILVAFLGSWEVTARLGWIDPFFYAMPSTIAGRIWDWVTVGTSEGPLWYHLWVTMEEALIGFFTGSIVGVVIGIALARNKMAADIFSIYIKVSNSIPRVVLAPIFILLF